MNPYVLLLNPDAVIQTQSGTAPGGLRLTRFGRRRRPTGGCRRAGRRSDSWCARLPTPAALILEALLLNRFWPGNPVNRRYRCLDWDSSSRSVVEQPAGAFFMVRRAVWQELGGLDESFFPLWFEDVDFCRRIRDRGFSLYYVPEAVAKHTGGHSIPQLATRDTADLLVS